MYAVIYPTIIKECGGEIDLIISTGDRRDVGTIHEFYIGGPRGNKRTEAHLKSFVSGFRINAFEEDPEGLTIFVDNEEFQRTRGQEEFVLLIRVALPGESMVPLWIICGQIAQNNYAAARYLVSHYEFLMRKNGAKRSFCLAFRLLDSQTYGPNQREVVGDLTKLAFSKPTARGA